jgi:peptide/nickel transport system permease protein
VLTFITRRLIGMVLVLVAVSFLVFVIFIVVPGGDPATRIAGKNANDQLIANIRHTWGFDRPFYTQYWIMMKKTFSGDLVSYTNQTNVVDQIKQGLPATFSLSIGAALIWIIFGVLVGIVAAVKAGKWADRSVTIVALVGISMPVFWLGIIVRYYLAEGGVTSFFPDGEYVALTANPAQWAWHLLLPWLVLAVLFIGFYGRVLRSNILDTINEDYVRTARAKGLDPRRVLMKHVLRNSLIPVVTLFGLDFAGVLGGGAILTETVFDLHGVGQYAAQSIGDFDLPPIMGVTLYGAFFIVLFNGIVDFAYAYLDPRIRPN